MGNLTFDLPLNGQLFRRLFLIFVSINLTFVLLHWCGDSLVSNQLAKARIKDAFDTGALVEAVQLHRNIPHGSPTNQIGIDQFSECFNALMLINPVDGGRLKAAVVPEYQTRTGKQMSCSDLNKIARNQIESSQLEGHTKARLWHGAKPFTAILLPKFEFYQISHLLRQLSYFGLALLLAYSVHRHPAAGITLLPFISVAMFGSGLDIYGGITDALPYTVALFLPIFVAWIQAKYSSTQAVYSAVVAGSIMSFVYILDGSLILALSLLIFLLYFTTPDLSQRQRWKITIILTLAFVLSFFSSFVFKQLISIPFIGFDQVWDEFYSLIQKRMGTSLAGRTHSPLFSLVDQIGVYDIATSWNMFLRNAIVRTGNTAWVAGITLAIIISMKFRTWRSISDLLAFCMIAFVVFFRYAAMTSHSYQHWFIVSRYVFVFFAFGMCMFIWMAILYRQMNSDLRNDDQ